MEQEEQLYNVIKDLFFILDEGDQQFFGQYGLSVTRYYALFHLVNAPGISLSELSRRLLCDKSNVTRMVQSLEKDELIERHPHETDKRSSRLFATEAGDALQEEVARAHRDYNIGRFRPAFTTIGETNLSNDLDQLKQILLAQWIAEQKTFV